MVKILTDEECSQFRKLPCGFNDMVRAIYAAGWTDGAIDATTPGEELGEKCKRICGGSIKLEASENCSCHMGAPCLACENRKLYCTECGWEQE